MWLILIVGAIWLTLQLPWVKSAIQSEQSAWQTLLDEYEVAALEGATRLGLSVRMSHQGVLRGFQVWVSSRGLGLSDGLLFTGKNKWLIPWDSLKVTSRWKNKVELAIGMNENVLEMPADEADRIWSFAGPAWPETGAPSRRYRYSFKLWHWFLACAVVAGLLLSSEHPPTDDVMVRLGAFVVFSILYGSLLFLLVYRMVLKRI